MSCSNVRGLPLKDRMITMSKKMFVVLILLLLFLSPLLYAVGYYDGVRKAFLFNSIEDTVVAANTIRYINGQQYKKAKSVQLSELEIKWAAISDISNGNLSIKGAFNKFISFRRLLSYDEEEYINRAKECYDRIIKTDN